MAHENYKFSGKTAQEWTALNPVLRNGERGYERDTGRFKVGNGISAWNQLPYASPSPSFESVSTVVAFYVDAHVHAELPHVVYDDGPSLLLAYQNAKV